MNMYAMLMIMLWNVNARLTPRGVTSPVAEAVESVVVELILDINSSGLQGDVSEVDRKRGRCRCMQKNQSVLDIQRKNWFKQQCRTTQRFLVEN
jgi:hypothetical protein